MRLVAVLSRRIPGPIGHRQLIPRSSSDLGLYGSFRQWTDSRPGCSFSTSVRVWKAASPTNVKGKRPELEEKVVKLIKQRVKEHEEAIALVRVVSYPVMQIVIQLFSSVPAI